MSTLPRKASWCFATVVAGTVSLGAVSTAMAQGVDTLGGYNPQQTGNYVTDDMLLNADKDPANWLHYGRDYETTRYALQTQINPDTVKNLVPKWTLSFGTLDGQDSQAVVVNGTVYVTSSYNRVFSVDGRTGEINWKYERELPADVFPQLCCDVVNRGVAPYKDKVYLATLDAHLVALKNNTGEVVWDQQVGDYTGSETFTIMPMALNNKIIVGTAGAEYGVRGWIEARDADTGERVWRTYTIPAEGEPNADTWAGESYKYGGGSAWITGSYDKDLGLLYWPVGNPGPDFDRHVREGDNLYSNSTLILDPDTGEIKNWFQYTPNDPYDYDGVNEVVLADVDGKKVWLHGDRNGHLYSINREDATCNWVVPLGEVNWAKGFGENCRPIMNWPEKDVVYDQVTRNIKPSLDGGKEWHPVAYSKRTQMVYVPTYNFSMDLQAKKMEWKRGEWYLGAKVINFNPGNGAIKAFDAATGDLVWTRPQMAPATSGMLATAGGLVFYGDPEGYFHAVRDDTGESLWSYNTGTGIHGNPTSFSIGGDQYIGIVVGAGGGGIWPLTFGDWLQTHTKGGALFVFGLHNG
ncbi:MAG: quinonprotein alcohol dehydrogenase [Rhodospirillaceae bacterium]|nr:quinonprotein alcohol dehydrogenase [Rhodospirillaceae bacterium]